MKLLTLSFDFRLFVWLAIGFIAFTVIGTVSHESGHYLMARCFGYEAKIHYASTDIHDNQKDWLFLKSVWQKYSYEIRSNKPFPEKERFEKIHSKHQRAGVWLTAGGPLQTMLTGTIGLILLILIRKRYFSVERLSLGLWLLIFITLFWLRQTANLLVVLPKSIIHGSISGHGDEFGLARHFHLPVWSILTVSALIGVVILLVVIFKFVPLKQRITFMTAGLVGGVSGYLLWLVFFGEILMP
jgi:hypothetical protein